MWVMMLVISVVLLVEAAALLAGPSLYRWCLECAEEFVGPSWPILYAVLFVLSGVVILIGGMYRPIPLPVSIAGGVLGVLGVFFYLASTQSYRHLAKWWISRPDWQYRAAGVVCAALAISILCFAYEIRP